MPFSRSCKVAIKIGSAIRSFGRPAFVFTAISVGRSSTRSWSRPPDDDELDARVAKLREQRRKVSLLGMRVHDVTCQASAPSGWPT